MWVRDQLGEWHLEGGPVTTAASVVYTRRGQPRSVTLPRAAGRTGTGTVCGRRVDPRGPLYERAAAPDPASPVCRTCRVGGPDA